MGFCHGSSKKMSVSAMINNSNGILSRQLTENWSD
jgi:hypothetical protein